MRYPDNWLVKLYQPEADSVKWRFLFNFLGIDSLPLRNERDLTHSLLKDETGLVIFDHGLLGEAFQRIESTCDQWIERGGGIAVSGHNGCSSLPAEFLARITDITERDPFTINALLQRYIPTYSRQHPRLGTRLPGLFSRVTSSGQICEIINLSPGGAFIRTTESLPSCGEELLLVVPLLGLRKEVELECSVVSRILPSEFNNYIQGIGVRFTAEEGSPALAELNIFVRYVLANDAVLNPRISPLNDSSSKKIGHDIKTVPMRTVKGRERMLTTDFC